MLCLFSFRAKCRIAALLWVAGLVLLPSGGFAAGEAEAKEEIVLGMSTALTRPAAALGQAMRRGVQTGLERANRAGGIHGRKLRLTALDDGYEPLRAAPNMRELVCHDKVLAIIGNVGTPTAIVALPIAVEEKTLFFAAYSGAGVLRTSPPNRYVINYRASYAEEAATMIDGLIDDLGLKPEEIAFFTQRDGYGDAGFKGGMAAWRDTAGRMRIRSCTCATSATPLQWRMRSRAWSSPSHRHARW